MNDNDNAKAIANLFCLMRGSNAVFAQQQFMGVWLYTDGIVVNNLEALSSERDGHRELFQKKLTANNIAVREFARCDCHQCWVAILNGGREKAVIARDFVWESAFECVGLPSVPPNSLEHGIQPPDIPTIREHVAFIKQLQKHGLLRCSNMTREGQRRTKSNK